MTKTTDRARVLGREIADPPMSRATAHELIEMCCYVGAPIDTALTEAQARLQIRLFRGAR